MRLQYIIACLSWFFLSVIITGCEMEDSKDKLTLFVGTYTNNGSEGIYKYSFDANTGELTNKSLAAKLENPSFLAISPDRNSLYAVGEIDNYIDASGSITTFRINNSNLVKVQRQPSMGENPCHVEVSSDGKFVSIANYTGGTASIYHIDHNGDLVQPPQVINHKILDTSKISHPHKTTFSNGELFITDLSLDVVRKYSKTNDGFVPSKQSKLDLAQGAGPRHLTFSADDKIVYVINELNSSITSFKRENNKFDELQTIKTTAQDFKGESFCADIHLSPDGRYLYGSNRGENTIVIFEVNDDTGILKEVGRESVKGDWPRNFSIDPTGNYLLVANQRSNNIVVFKRDIELGTLKFINDVALPSPVCLQFY